MNKPRTNYDAWVSFVWAAAIVAMIAAIAIHAQREAERKGIAPRQSSIWINLSK
ncbi:hypothetical protein [Spirosoma sp. KUDC1026]|uniref:hypothetical protein n=1 Tax=Spirosoma sp. KUDC1026 TaxID=2745947 RepID=UPI00159B8BB1|nr:hypothetical protein [Spirosoma sp. KUDC1026]QKZ15163.1 hypothetical protein HU175_22080 [Spirosoma sp. KUDC1026]